MATEPSGPLDLKPNDHVTALGKKGPEEFDRATVLPTVSGLEAAAFTPADVPKRYCFVGYLGTPFNARDEDWCVLYLDWELDTWLLIQKDGVLARERLTAEEGAPAPQDALWVKADTAVSSGRGSLSIEGLFLMGSFARAADFDVAPLTGGTLAASAGGYGLAGQSPPRCCYKTNRRP